MLYSRTLDLFLLFTTNNKIGPNYNVHVIFLSLRSCSWLPTVNKDKQNNVTLYVVNTKDMRTTKDVAGTYQNLYMFNVLVDKSIKLIYR